jgi:hypothetical protein
MRAPTPQTAADLQKNFQTMVDGITTGEYDRCPTGLGFHGAVVDALNRLAADPHHPSALLVNARIALAHQLSGDDVKAATQWIEQELEDGRSVDGGQLPGSD